MCINKVTGFIEISHWDEMVEDDLLSKFKQEIYPNKGISNKALSKHKLCSTK